MTGTLHSLAQSFIFMKDWRRQWMKFLSSFLLSSRQILKELDPGWWRRKEVKEIYKFLYLSYLSQCCGHRLKRTKWLMGISLCAHNMWEIRKGKSSPAATSPLRGTPQAKRLSPLTLFAHPGTKECMKRPQDQGCLFGRISIQCQAFSFFFIY